MGRESLLVQLVGENETMSICSASFSTTERLQGEIFEDFSDDHGGGNIPSGTMRDTDCRMAYQGRWKRR